MRERENEERDRERGGVTGEGEIDGQRDCKRMRREQEGELHRGTERA